MKKIIIGICAISISLMTFISCTHGAEDVQPAGSGTGTGTGTGGGTGTGTGTGGGTGTGTGGGGTNPADTALCFERDVLPIFISNCAKSGCHDAASHQDGYVFTSYQTITAKKFRAGDPDETELYEKITETKADKIMPPPPAAPLTAQQVNLIYRWIKGGAPNTTGCSSGCDSTKFTFSGVIQPMINQYCKGCHSGPSAPLGVSLDSYTGVKSVASDGRLLGVIKHLPAYPAMPRGGAKLSNCQIMQVEQWVASGAPNN